MSVFSRWYRDIIPNRFLKISIWGNSKKSFFPESEKTNRKQRRKCAFYIMYMGRNPEIWL